MQPVRPRMKKVLLTGFVACMSLFHISSGAPIPRPTRPAEPTTASLPASSSIPNQNTGSSTSSSPSPSPSTTTRQAQANQPSTTPSRATSGPSTAPTPGAPPRPSSFSLGFNLGQIDYAAAGIARRVSRIFVKRMSAQSSRSTRSAQGAGAGVVQSQEGEEKEGEKEKERDRVTLVPVVESESGSLDPAEEDGDEVGRPVPVHDVDDPAHTEDDTSSVNEPKDGEMVAPDIRACRWGCI
ncbi:hypothetical protein DFJ43DRAFT_1038254 [Lentinula guzmanii]|uniref:Uncharacterized protein n=1 Tax=Lentinula guzmanii TaxID=2804957 RepID=A0AA38N2D7_9AGAR|nr:hypothetical protein DFJ43DRAFT_1038254 [Lentinula guzmanii]